jgi:hypothetical protein
MMWLKMVLDSLAIGLIDKSDNLKNDPRLLNQGNKGEMHMRFTTIKKSPEGLFRVEDDFF